MERKTIQNKIYELRGRRVMLDFDLALLYQVETSALKRAVRRNSERFPEDFMFELSNEEYNELKISIRCQIGILETEDGRGKYPKYPPFAFTEQGVSMAFGGFAQSDGCSGQSFHHARLCRPASVGDGFVGD